MPTEKSDKVAYHMLRDARDDLNGLRRIATTWNAPVPQLQARMLRPHPHNTADHADNILLTHAWGFGGVNGLTSALYALAQRCTQEQTVSSKQFSYITEDDIGLQNMLLGMNSNVVEAIIRGTICYEQSHNVDFEHIVQNEHTLQQTPGNYIQYVCRRAHQHSTGSAASDGRSKVISGDSMPDRGCGLTCSELRKIHGSARRYLSPGEGRHAKEVDEQFIGYSAQNLDKYNVANGLGYRRFISPHETTRIPKIMVWLDALEHRYIEPIEQEVCKTGDETLLDLPMMRSLAEVGWGHNLSARALRHEDHKSSNYLWTFWLALIKKELDPHWTTFEVRRYMILALPREGRDDNETFELGMQDALACDLATSLLAGSFWFMGGLNPAEAGGGGVQQASFQKQDILDALKKQHFRNYQPMSRHQLALTACEQKLTHAQALLDDVKNRAAIEREIVRRKETLLEKIQKIEMAMSESEEKLAATLIEIEKAESEDMTSQPSNAPTPMRYSSPMLGFQRR